MEVQQYLRSFNDADAAIEAVQSEYGIKVGREGDLVVLNYDLLSPKCDLADDCRALVLRVPTFDVVSFSFRRFYNHHEGRAAVIDWSTAEVGEKLDGSLIVFFHDGERWRMQTRGTIDATGPLLGWPYTFADRVMAVLGADGYSSLDEMLGDEDTDHCFVCEYTGPFNRIVTRYEDERLSLLTVTDRSDQSDLGPHGHNIPWPFHYPRTFDLGSLDAAIESMNSLPKLDEGYVVRDAAGNRIKVKSPSYMAIHAAINAGNAPTEKNFAALALRGDTDEIKGYFPEFAGHIEAFEQHADAMAGEAEKAWCVNCAAVDQKTFALAVKDLPMASWLFARRNSKTELAAREWMASDLRPERFFEMCKQGGK